MVDVELLKILTELSLLAIGSIAFFFMRGLVAEVRHLRLEMHQLNLKLERHLSNISQLEHRLSILESALNDLEKRKNKVILDLTKPKKKGGYYG